MTKKYLIIGILVFLYLLPFLGVQLNIWTGKSFMPLINFGITNLNDFYKLWISLGAVTAGFVNIFLLITRIEQQKKAEQNNRFKTSVELLESENEAVIIGGIHSLFDLSKESPNIYAEKTFKLLCAYIRSNSMKKETPEIYTDNMFPVKCQTIIDLLFKYENLKSYPFKNKKNEVYKADLRLAKLSQANLIGAKMSGADLTEAKFYKADLTGADLSFAVLRKAKFQSIHAYGTNFSETKLQGADFNTVLVENDSKTVSKLVGADFTNAKMGNTILSNSVMYGAILEKANLDGAILYNVDLSHSNMDESKLRGAYMKDVNLYKASTKEANLSGVYCINNNSYETFASKIFGQTDKQSDLSGIERKKKNRTSDLEMLREQLSMIELDKDIYSRIFENEGFDESRLVNSSYDEKERYLILSDY